MAQQQSKFPIFDDADVRIVIRGGRQYQLHSAILKQISPTLREKLSDKITAKLSSKAIRRGTTVRFRLQAVKNPKASEENIDIEEELQVIPLNEDGKPTVNVPIGLDLEAGRVVPAHILAYHAVLGAFYNIPIDFGYFEREALTDVLTTAMNITLVAEYLRCVHVITKPIEATLLATGQLLQQSIARNPIAWLDYANRVKLRSIFREALIHSTGQYQMPVVKDSIFLLKPLVAEILQRKAKALKEAVRTAELNITSYYPTHIQREKTIGRADKDSIGRASYANDIMSWIGLVVLRHFFTQNIIADQTRDAPDMGKEMVDLIMKGGDAYLSRPDLDGFHQHFPMSSKGSSVVEYKLSEMKDYVKKFVVALTQNTSQLNLNETPVKHFTCTQVEFSDYPWETDYEVKVEGPDDEQTDDDDDDDDDDVPEGGYEGDEDLVLSMGSQI